MRKYYLNSKGLKYVSQVCGVEESEIEKLNKGEHKNFVYVPNVQSGVNVLCNFDKDILVKVGLSDNIEELKKKYNVKEELEVGDMFIVSSQEKYIVKPLDTIDKIANKFGVSIEYLINKNNLKTTKVFVGQVLIV